MDAPVRVMLKVCSPVRKTLAPTLDDTISWYSAELSDSNKMYPALRGGSGGGAGAQPGTVPQ